MIVSTADILYLVISFCIIWVTVFLCWMFYYLMRLLRNANKIVEEFRVRLQNLTETIDYIRGKVENMSSLLTLAGNGMSGLMKKVAERKAKKIVDDGIDKVNDVAKEAVEMALGKKVKRRWR